MLNRIARVRRQKGMTRRELAEKLNLSMDELANWETGDDKPTQRQFQALCAALQTQPEKLYHRPDLMVWKDLLP